MTSHLVAKRSGRQLLSAGGVFVKRLLLALMVAMVVAMILARSGFRLRARQTPFEEQLQVSDVRREGGLLWVQGIAAAARQVGIGADSIAHDSGDC
jgi:hypothetical protein